jgi:hypothetical protein
MFQLGFSNPEMGEDTQPQRSHGPEILQLRVFATNRFGPRLAAT